MRGPFGAFIRAPWQRVWTETAPDGAVTEKPIAADMDPATGARFAHALEMRAAKIAWCEALSGMPGQIAFLRYEAVNRDPARAMRALARGFDLPAPACRAVHQYKGDRQVAYAPRHYPALAPEDRAWIDAHLDHDREARIGYAPWRIPHHDGLGLLHRPVWRALWKRLRGGAR